MIVIDEHVVEQGNKLKYLGAWISSDGRYNI